MNLNYIGGTPGSSGYVAIWEFRVSPANAARFEQLYRPAGKWADFFRTGEGYLGTTLNRDVENPLRYVTLDFWQSADAYHRFRQSHSGHYQQIDAECESLTEQETHLGSFSVVE